MIRLRPAVEEELPALSALCLRSKAVWGYDDAFMAACREELTLTPADLQNDQLQVAEDDEGVVGVVKLDIESESAELSKLFIEPARIGSGAGRVLFTWAVERARGLGAKTMRIESDPDAAAFYRHMGAEVVGTAPSGSIPGRVLPLLTLDLSGAGSDAGH
ncbi:GNAT family N-acetyltransferase [Pelagibius sp.]|uniref:GNAT family N-acetyltransferase n=1 Tax=Pelagibius sp. TaxID=1931238 RepID=UPI003B50883A